MDASNEVLERSTPEEHLVQFFDKQNENLLIENITRYLSQGWMAGDALLVIAIEKRNETIVEKLKQLNLDPDAAIRDGRLVLGDSQKMLERFMIENQPDWGLFQYTIGAVAGDAKVHAASGALRAYGDMVALLWEAGRYSAAIRLEHYWNELREMIPFKLFCAYQIDILSEDFRPAAVDALLRTHTHLLAGEPSHPLEHALSRAMDEILGPEVDNVRTLMQANQSPRRLKMPFSEASILWLRRNIPEQAAEIVDRARKYCAAAQAVP